jgi:zinc transport system ATP-binding protein
MNENKLIEVENVFASYDGQNMALKNVSVTIMENEFLGVIGPNGGGKTTLLKVILGLLKPTSGNVRFYQHGKQTQSLRIGYLPQMNRIDRHFPISVKDVIASGLMASKPRFRNYTDEQNHNIDEVMQLMGLADLAERPIGMLSGGQLQRTLLGRAIIDKPQVLILDEPASYGDTHFESQFFRLLENLRRTSSIILVTHDAESIGGMATRMVLVKETLTPIK